MLDLYWKYGLQIVDDLGLVVGGNVKVNGISSRGAFFSFEENRNGTHVYYGWADKNDGKIFQGPFVHYRIVPKPAPVREIWINVCEAEGLDHHVLSSYQTRKDAMADPCWNRKKIACIKIQFTEGEGL